MIILLNGSTGLLSVIFQSKFQFILITKQFNQKTEFVDYQLKIYTDSLECKFNINSFIFIRVNINKFYLLQSPVAQKKAQPSNNNNNLGQRRQQQQNRIRQQQILLRTFGQRKKLSGLQKIQTLLLIVGIAVSFAFAYSNNANQDWQASKDSNQHQRVFFTSIISYCFTVIIAYFWISQSKGFEYTFETNLNYFKTHLPALQNNNLINLQQQQNEQNLSNSEIDIEAQQPIQQQPDANLVSISVNIQHNQEEQDLNDVVNQSNIVQLNAPGQINQDPIQMEQQLQVLNLNNNEQFSKIPMQEEVVKIEIIDQNIQEEQKRELVKAQSHLESNSDVNQVNNHIESFMKSPEAPIDGLDNVDKSPNQTEKQRGIVVTLLAENQSDSDPKVLQIDQDIKRTTQITEDDPSLEEMNAALDGIEKASTSFKLMIDNQQKIILFGESDDTSEETQEIQSKQSPFKGEINNQSEKFQQQENDQQKDENNNQIIKEEGEENIPSTIRNKENEEKVQQDIKSKALIIKHKNKDITDKKVKQESSQEEDLESSVFSSVYNQNETLGSNREDIVYPKIVVHTDNKILSHHQCEFVSYQYNPQSVLPQQEIDKPQSPATIKDTVVKINPQSEEQSEDQVIGLIKFDSNESSDEEEDETSIYQPKTGIEQQDAQNEFIYQREEDIISPKQNEKLSSRKEDHNKIINSGWNEYMKDDITAIKQQIDQIGSKEEHHKSELQAQLPINKMYDDIKNNSDSHEKQEND